MHSKTLGFDAVICHPLQSLVRNVPFQRHMTYDHTHINFTDLLTRQAPVTGKAGRVF